MTKLHLLLEFRTLNEVTKYIISSKLLGAEYISVKDAIINITAGEFYKTSSISKLNSRMSRNVLLIASDQWSIKNSEFDLISGLLPVISPSLYKLLTESGNDMVQKINKRGLIIHAFDNGISAFFDQDPLLINSELGIFSHDKSEYLDEQPKNAVYNFQKRRTTFHLSEINSYEAFSKTKEFKVLYVYVSPRELNNEESQKLNTYKSKDSEYYKGSTKGWSLLITGSKNNNIIIKAGIQDRQTLVKMLPQSFWEENKELTFKFSDGSLMKPDTSDVVEQ